MRGSEMVKEIEIQETTSLMNYEENCNSSK